MMKKQRGITAIELIIGAAIVCIFAGILVNGGAALSDPNSSVSFGFNGMTEMRCIGGYRFVVGSEGQARQVLDEFGKGAKCQ